MVTFWGVDYWLGRNTRESSTIFLEIFSILIGVIVTLGYSYIKVGSVAHLRIVYFAVYCGIVHQLWKKATNSLPQATDMEEPDYLSCCVSCAF